METTIHVNDSEKTAQLAKEVKLLAQMMHDLRDIEDERRFTHDYESALMARDAWEIIKEFNSHLRKRLWAHRNIDNAKAALEDLNRPAGEKASQA